MSYYDVIKRRVHNMKIFMFCIMTLVDGNTMIYQYSETFNSKFACQNQARIEAAHVSDPSKEMTSVNFVCDTKENLKNYI